MPHQSKEQRAAYQAAYHQRNKQKKNARSSRHYRENKERFLLLSKASYQRQITKYREWLKKEGCSVCDCRIVNCLQIHHLDSEYKKECPTILRNKTDVQEDKALILCANCHMLFHMFFGGVNKPFPRQTKNSAINIIRSERENQLDKYCEIILQELETS